jgi:small subunit ribosomal protein S16
MYRLVVIDKARANAGGVLDNLGSYASRSSEPQNYQLAEDKVLAWLKKGALPSESAKTLLVKAGIWKKFKG